MDGQIIFKGQKNSIVKYWNDYLIVENKHITDIDYISYLWANGGKRLKVDNIIRKYCHTSLNIDNL